VIDPFSDEAIEQYREAGRRRMLAREATVAMRAALANVESCIADVEVAQERLEHARAELDKWIELAEAACRHAVSS